MKKYLAPVSVGALFAPMLAFAVTVDAAGGITGLVTGIKAVINILVPLAIVIAVVIVIWGAFQIIIGGSDEEARKAGRGKILWGLIGLFLLLAAWALVSIVINSVSFTGNADVTGTLF